MLDALLDQTLGEIEAKAAMMPRAKEGDILMTDPEARIRLSNSTLNMLHSCERKFQKAKLLRTTAPRETSAAMSFGSSYGAGVQHYMVARTMGQSVKEAVAASQYVAWAAYNPPLEDEVRFVERSIDLIAKAVPFLEAQLRTHKIAEFNGRLANELSFNLNISSKYYYVGYIDLILQDIETGRYSVVDIKTTALTATDLRPYYKNSDQCLGYSIVLDAVAGKDLAEFDVSYWPTQLKRAKKDLFDSYMQALTFPTTLKDRFDWFLKIYLDVNYMQALEPMDAYPKRGGACMAYNRVCNFYTECGSVALDEPQVYTPDDIDYDFTFELGELLADHQRRLEKYLITAHEL